MSKERPYRRLIKNLKLKKAQPAILANKDHTANSVFLPENLLREARRQKEIPDGNIPKICLLDPDGDLVTYLLEIGEAKKNTLWACYHSNLYSFHLDGIEIGIIPCIVGASYAVLVAEQLFVSGSEYLISVTSAGIITPPNNKKRFALITEAIRDEGTSYHYLPADLPAVISKELFEQFQAANPSIAPIWFPAKSWTTDAPYRETQPAIDQMAQEKVTCVEMEAAALYAFAQAKNKKVLCFAHLTNTMAQEEGDFEKGAHMGSLHTLDLLKKIISRLDT